jgi:tetratricopeptide (TPR) repeat protein
MVRPLVVLSVALVATAPLLGQRNKALRDSIAALEERVRADSTNAEALYRLSILYYEARRYEDESRVLRRAIAVDPRYAPAILSLSYEPYERRPKLWEEERKNRVPQEWQTPLEESRRLVRQAFLVDPMVDLRVLGVEAPPESMVVIPDYGEATTEFMLYLGVVMFSRARYELSYDAFRKYFDRGGFKNEPRDSLPDYLFWMRGLAAAHMGVHNVALEDIQTLLDRSLKQELADTLIQVPLETNDYRYLLAVLSERARKPADAVRLYQEALANDLGLYMAHVRLAELYRQFKMWPQAIEEQRRAIAANPDDATALLELSNILREAGQPADAEEPLRQAMTQNPLDPRIPYTLGLVAHQLNKTAEAREAFARVVALGSGRYASLVADAKQRLAGLPGN